MSASGPLHRYQLTRRLAQAASRRGAKREWRRWLVSLKSVLRGMSGYWFIALMLFGYDGYRILAAGSKPTSISGYSPLPGLLGIYLAFLSLGHVIDWRDGTKDRILVCPVPLSWHAYSAWRVVLLGMIHITALILAVAILTGAVSGPTQALMVCVSTLGGMAAAYPVIALVNLPRGMIVFWSVLAAYCIAAAFLDFSRPVIALNPASWAWLGMRSLNVEGNTKQGVQWLAAAAGFGAFSLWILYLMIRRKYDAVSPEPLGPKERKGPVPNYPGAPVATHPHQAGNAVEDSSVSSAGESTSVEPQQNQESVSQPAQYTDVRLLNVAGTKAAAAAALRKELNGLRSRESAEASESAGLRIAQAWTGLKPASSEHGRKVVLLACFAFVPVLLLLGFTGSRIDPWKLIALNAALVAVCILIARLRATTREMTIVSQSWLEVMPIALSDHAALWRRTWRRGDRAALWFSLIFAAACLSIPDFTLLHAIALAGLGGLLPWLLFPAIHLFHLTIRERTARGQLARWLEAAPHMLVFAAFLLLLSAPVLSWRLLAPGWIHWNFLAWIGCLHVTAQVALYAFRRHWTQLL